MGKKSFREKLNDIVSTTVEKTKDKKMKSTFSRKMYNEVVTALVNDPDYEMETVQVKKNLPTAVVTKPVRAFREKLLNPILADLKVDSEDAKKYIECALAHKDENRDLADTFYDLSQQEVKHADMLHKQVVEMIDQYKQEHGAPPENMLAIYEYLHEQEIEAMKEVKMMQQMYK